MTDAPPPRDDDLLAAEHALDLLDPAERRAAEGRMARDPAFAAEVQAWSERLAPLAEEAAPAEPPPELWARIARGLDGAEPNGAAPPPALRFWKGLALGASGLAVASLAAVALLLARPATPVAEVATLLTPEGGTAVVVAFDERTGALLVTPGPGLRTQGHTPHLWLVNPGGGVRLVGAIDPARAATHSLPRALARQAGVANGLALSLEQPGTTPRDRPSGAVIASGDFDQL